MKPLAHRMTLKVTAWRRKMGLTFEPGRWLAWARKGGLAILDQSLFSGANFLVNILLARWLPPKEYGAFAVALSVFYLLAGFHTAVLTEPMMVFGAGKYSDQFAQYLGMLLYGHWGISLLIAGGLGIVAFVMQRMASLAMAKALAGLAVASPFLLFLWLARRAYYVLMRPAWAAAGSSLNLLVVLGGVFLLWRAGRLTAFSGLVLLGGGAGAAALVLAWFLSPKLRDFTSKLTAMEVAREHWGYGRWAILNGLAYSAAAQLWILFIPIVLGLQASAAVAAVRNLYRPVNLFMQAIGLTLLPMFASWMSGSGGEQKLRFRALVFAGVSGTIVGVYGVVLTTFAKPVLNFLYGGRYSQYWLLVPLFAGVAVFTVALQYLLLALKARAIVKPLPLIWGTAAGASVLLSVPLMFGFEVYGAVTGYLFGYMCALLVGFWLFQRHFSARKSI